MRINGENILWIHLYVHGLFYNKVREPKASWEKWVLRKDLKEIRGLLGKILGTKHINRSKGSLK